MKGRIAFVTGGNRGLGKAIALGFGSAGAHVVLVSRNLELSETVLDEIKRNGGGGISLKCDLNYDEDIYSAIETAIDHYGKIDILVNNSGISPFVEKSEEVTKEMWSEVLQVNLLAPFLLCREAAKIMMKHNWGRIINIASVGGFIALPRQVAYCASKGALIQMTKVLAAEWAGKYNITVNCIAPGYFETDLTQGMRSSDKIRKNLLQRNPSGRFGAPKELVGAATYFASEEASFTTGCVLIVDGGMTAS